LARPVTGMVSEAGESEVEDGKIDMLNLENGHGCSFGLASRGCQFRVKSTEKLEQLKFWPSLFSQPPYQ
jgi:hypothetical protein